jgi:biotin transport system substrate-specific component
LLQRSAAAREVAAVLLFGALTAISAQIQIPFQPVPLTGTVFMVLLAGALLGPRLGLLSQLTYLAIGLVGAPVFAGGKFGLLTMLGPTGGYLVAFPLAAYLAGVVAMRAQSRLSLTMGLALSSLTLLLVGGLGLALWGRATGLHPGIPEALAYGFATGVIPFVPLDMVKAVAAAAVAWPVIRRDP